MITECVENSINIVAFPSDLNPVDYIRNIKLSSYEMVLFQQSFIHPKTCVAIQYLCHLHYKFEYPDKPGFNWPVIRSNRKDGKSIASRLGIKSINTLSPILNELRTYRQFRQGEYIDLDSINFDGKLFAAYHNGRTNDVRWFINFQELTNLSNSILNRIGHTQPVAGAFPKNIDAQLSNNCIHIETNLTPDCTQTGGSYTNEVALDVGVKVKEGENTQHPNTAATIVADTPFAVEPPKTVGNTKQPKEKNSAKKENGNVFLKADHLWLCNSSTGVYMINETNALSAGYMEQGIAHALETQDSGEITVRKISQKECDDLHWKQHSAFNGYVNALEDTLKVKGVVVSPIDRGQLNNIQKKLYEMGCPEFTEQIFFQLAVNWGSFQTYAKENHNSAFWWIKNESYLTPTQIYKHFHIIFTWFIDRLDKNMKLADLQYQAIVTQKRKADPEWAARLDAHNAKHKLSYV